MTQVVSSFNREHLVNFIRHKNYGGSLTRDSKGSYKTTQLIECKESLGEIQKGQTYLCLRGSSQFDKAQFVNINGNPKKYFIRDELVQRGLSEKDLVVI